MTRATAALILTLAIVIAGCGDDGGRDRLTEDGLRECLAKNGIGPGTAGQQKQSLPVLLLGAAPDFVAYAQDGTTVAVIVHGNDAKAQQTAADVEAAVPSDDGPAGGDKVMVKRNAVLVFTDTPSDATRAAAEGCLD